MDELVNCENGEQLCGLNNGGAVEETDIALEIKKTPTSSIINDKSSQSRRQRRSNSAKKFAKKLIFGEEMSNNSNLIELLSPGKIILEDSALQEITKRIQVLSSDELDTVLALMTMKWQKLVDIENDLKVKLESLETKNIPIKEEKPIIDEPISGTKRRLSDPSDPNPSKKIKLEHGETCVKIQEQFEPLDKNYVMLNVPGVSQVKCLDDAQWEIVLEQLNQYMVIELKKKSSDARKRRDIIRKLCRSFFCA